MPEQLPPGWVKATLGEIAVPSRQRVLPAEVPDMPYVGLEHIESKTMRLLRHGYARDVRSSSIRFFKEDVLYGKMRPYWWLAFSRSNFRYASQWCNQRRVDDEYGTSGGKADHFPLLANGVRARYEGDNLDLEDPELLDPADPEDWKLLTFLPDGYPTPARPKGTLEHQRALKSIEIYHLHCKQLANGRFAVAGTIQRIVQDLERLRPRIDDLQIRRLYKNRQVELLQAIHPDAEYSAAARAYARSEVYKLEGGHQVKREWLEEMLN